MPGTTSSIAKIEPALDPIERTDASLQAYAGLLNRLRFAAAACRASARVDLFRACALLSTEKDVAVQAHVDALVRTLSQAIGRRPVFHAPGTREMSADELWLLRLIERTEVGDSASAAFLAARKAAPEHRRSLRFLAHGVATAAAGR
ncbi:MAG: hypothetical protein AAGI51_00100 [Pseudomonadota bacterium]